MVEVKCIYLYHHHVDLMNERGAGFLPSMRQTGTLLSSSINPSRSHIFHVESQTDLRRYILNIGGDLGEARRSCKWMRPGGAKSSASCLFPTGTKKLPSSLYLGSLEYLDSVNQR